MQTRFVITGLAILLAAIAFYAVSQKKQDEVEPASATPEESGVSLDTSFFCPDTANSIALDFEDTHSDATREAVAAYEQAELPHEFLEPDKPRLIQSIDLNNDGREDFVTLYTGVNWCGSLGCSVEVFIQNAEGGYEASQAFYTTKGQSLVLESTANGFRQMLSPVQHGLPDEYHLWAWTGEKYESDKQCLKR